MMTAYIRWHFPSHPTMIKPIHLNHRKGKSSFLRKRVISYRLKQAKDKVLLYYLSLKMQLNTKFIILPSRNLFYFGFILTSASYFQQTNFIKILFREFLFLLLFIFQFSSIFKKSYYITAPRKYTEYNKGLFLRTWLIEGYKNEWLMVITIMAEKLVKIFPGDKIIEDSLIFFFFWETVGKYRKLFEKIRNLRT